MKNKIEKKQQRRFFIYNMVAFALRSMKMFFQQLWIFIKEQPDVVLTTGAGVAVPTCVIAKVFHRKIIYIESFARISSPNRTGMFIYKFADLFIVQWESLLKFYPKAVYGGWLY